MAYKHYGTGTRMAKMIGIVCVSGLSACSSDEPKLLYENTEFSYSFEYPDSMKLHEYTPGYIVIGPTEDPEVELVVEVGTAGTFGDFALERVLQSCAADGHDLSLSCTGASADREFVSSHGLSGSEVHLRNEASHPGTEEIIAVDDRGPFFIFDITPSGAGEYTALFIRPSTARPTDQIDADLIEEVARSLRLTHDR